MDNFDDLSLFSSDMNTDQHSMFDPLSQNDLTGFSNEHGFQPKNSIDATGYMEIDDSHHQFPEFHSQVDDFLSHDIQTHQFVYEFPHNYSLNDSFHKNESNNQHAEMHFDQTSFTGKYSDAEISRLKEDVNNCQYEVNHLHDEVHHHENMVSLADTKKGHETGDYANEVSDLDKVESKYSDAVDRLNNAIEKLSNAT